jgi:uncharacterized protein YukE
MNDELSMSEVRRFEVQDPERLSPIIADLRRKLRDAEERWEAEKKLSAILLARCDELEERQRRVEALVDDWRERLKDEYEGKLHGYVAAADAWNDAIVDLQRALADTAVQEEQA